MRSRLIWFAAAALCGLGTWMAVRHGASVRHVFPPPSAARENDTADPFGKRWITPLSEHEALYAPGQLMDFGARTALFRVRLDTGSSALVPTPQVVFLSMVADRTSGRAVISGKSWSDLGRDGVWLFGTSMSQMETVIPLARSGSFVGLIASPGGRYVACSLATLKDQAREREWTFKRKLEGSKAPEPRYRYEGLVLDVGNHKVRTLRIIGLPLCWDAVGHTAFFSTERGVVAYSVADDAVRLVSHRADIWYAFCPKRLRSRIVLACLDDGLEVQLVDDKFRVMRRVCTIPIPSTAVAVSPEGTRIAYGRGKEFYVLDVKDGRERALPAVSADMGPEWADDQSVVLASSNGLVHIVSLPSKAQRTIVVKAMTARPQQ